MVWPGTEERDVRRVLPDAQLSAFQRSAVQAACVDMWGAVPAKSRTMGTEVPDRLTFYYKIRKRLPTWTLRLRTLQERPALTSPLRPDRSTMPMASIPKPVNTYLRSPASLITGRSRGARPGYRTLTNDGCYRQRYPQSLFCRSSPHRISRPMRFNWNVNPGF